MFAKLLIFISLITYISCNCDRDRQGKMTLRIISASGVIDRAGEPCDHHTECDMFVRVWLNEELLAQTWHIMDRSSTHYELQLATPAWVCDSDRIKFEMFDYDFLSPDDPMGQYSLLVKEAKGRERVKMFETSKDLINYLEYDLDFKYRLPAKNQPNANLEYEVEYKTVS